MPNAPDIPPSRPPSRGGSLLAEIGLRRPVRSLIDTHLALAVAAALPVWFALALGAAGPIHRPPGLWAWMGFVLWQPFLEELFFRGLLQGQLLRLRFRRPPGPVSAANLLVSVAFAAFHLPGQGPAWAIAVAVPSLVFGHLRERFESVWPAVAMHALYNAGFGVAALLAAGAANAV